MAKIFFSVCSKVHSTSATLCTLYIATFLPNFTKIAHKLTEFSYQPVLQPIVTLQNLAYTLTTKHIAILNRVEKAVWTSTLLLLSSYS